MAEKIIKGQPYIFGDSLVQDQTKITSSGKAIDIPAAVIIEDIWNNLRNNSGSGPTAYKTNPPKKDYFYWEVKQTSIESDDIEVTINFECPKPKEGLYDDLLRDGNIDPDSSTITDMGDYTAYWYKKIYTARENYEKEMAIQKKEITFNDYNVTGYTNDDFGETVNKSGYTIKNDDLGDITNLLSLF